MASTSPLSSLKMHITHVPSLTRSTSTSTPKWTTLLPSSKSICLSSKRWQKSTASSTRKETRPATRKSKPQSSYSSKNTQTTTNSPRSNKSSKSTSSLSLLTNRMDWLLLPTSSREMKFRLDTRKNWTLCMKSKWPKDKRRLFEENHEV